MEENTQVNFTTGNLCKNCGSKNVNIFCSDCGQEVFTQKFSVKRLFKEWISAFYNYSGGVIYTVNSMIFKPGESIKNYVNGRTIPYWNPFNYFLITFSIYLFFSIKFGVLTSGNDYEKFTNDYASYIVIFTIPFISAASYLLFKKSGYNYAENLILNTFISSQTNLYAAVLLVTYSFLGRRTAGLITIFASVIYQIWVYKTFYNSGIILTIIKVMLITILSMILTLGILSVIYLFFME